MLIQQPQRDAAELHLTILCYSQALTDTTYLQYIETRRDSTQVESGFCRGVWMTKCVVVNRHTLDLLYLDNTSLGPNSLTV